MRYWKFLAVNAWGTDVSGSFRGSRTDLEQMLAARRLHAVSVQWDLGAVFGRLSPTKRFGSAELARLFMDAHNMYLTGLGIIPMLESLAQAADHPSQRIVWEAIRASVESGESLSAAMARSRAFPAIVPMVVSSGEKAGRLEASFQMLGRHFQKISDAGSKLSQALIYPAILFAILVGISIFLSVQVVPRLQGLLPSGGGMGMRQMVNAGTFLVHAWIPLMLVAGAGVGVAIRRKGALLRLFEMTPVVGPVFKEQGLADYFANLTILLGSGRPLLQIMEDMRRISPTTAGEHVYACREYMLSGLAFWESLQRDSFFPSTLAAMVRRGEETARLEQYCGLIAEYFHTKVERRLDGAINSLQPTMLLLGGAFLMLIAAGFLAPIYANLSKIAGG